MQNNDIFMKQVLQAFEGLKRNNPVYMNKVVDFLRTTLEKESQVLRTANDTTQIYRQQGKCTMIQEVLKHIDEAESLLKQFESRER